eukprot:COSAG01_NODE_9245_length_2503_cov_28.917324_5_plen_52_part_00
MLRLKLQLPDSLSLLPVTSGGSELLPPHPPQRVPCAPSVRLCAGLASRQLS